jgi:hypothetical protein
MRRLIFVLTVCLLFGVVSCTPEEEYTFPTESSKDSTRHSQDYANAFKSKFGNSTSFNTVKTVEY